MTKWVYAFGDGKSEGEAGMKNLLGGKGANLAEMSNLGLPVPPGFSITTEFCTHYYANGESYPADLKEQVAKALREVGELAGGTLGDPARPLLVSVRSGARVSMPGMMDTVLNLGLNAATAEGLAKITGDARFAYDSYRRFIQMYSDVVLGVDHAHFEEILHARKEDKGVELDTDLDADDLKAIANDYKKQVEKELGKPFPENVEEQLWGAIGAVFGSWRSPRANTYRKLNNIPEEWGTAVTVQAMVFGNRGETSATGVAFTRDPARRSPSRKWCASARAAASLRCKRRCPRPMTNCWPSASGWKSTTATCRTWNSPCRKASCSCCRPARASAPRKPLSRRRWTWWARG
jgi:pyruvate,orthophosphate dikinase